MAKIIAGMFITLNGVVEAPERWNPPLQPGNDRRGAARQMARCDTHLYGRRSYELFRSVFTGPTADQIRRAPMMNDPPKTIVTGAVRTFNWFDMER